MNLNIHSELPERKAWRIGCVGSGFIMSDCHLVAYGKAGFNPVAIASRTQANVATCAEAHNIGTVHDSIDQLLDDESIEVLDLAVPPDNQLEIIKAACARGTAKGILAQKPLGANYAEAVEAVEACEAAGIILAVRTCATTNPCAPAKRCSRTVPSATPFSPPSTCAASHTGCRGRSARAG